MSSPFELLFFQLHLMSMAVNNLSYVHGEQLAQTINKDELFASESYPEYKKALERRDILELMRHTFQQAEQTVKTVMRYNCNSKLQAHMLWCCVDLVPPPFASRLKLDIALSTLRSIQ